MAATRVDKYAAKTSQVEAVQWNGGDVAFRLINEWSEGRVRVSGTDLILQEVGRTMRVPLGDYIVRTDPVTYHWFTQEEMHDIYAKLADV